jgi:histidine ammonia-lyase
MGSISGRKLHQVIDNIEYIQAIELLYAAQAMDFRRPLKSTPVIEACHELVRQHVTFIQDDRVFADDINSLHKLITEGSLLQTAGEAAIAHQIDLSHDEFGIY